MADQQPRPKSPPGYIADLYGNTRQHAKLHLLETEICFLQEELKSLETIQPTSRCCKELNDFVATKTDPFIAVNQKSHESDCCWRRFSGCCRSDDARHQQGERKCCCCCCCCGSARENCCPKCCSSHVCSCFHQKCCLFKLSCSGNCLSKLKLCHTCVPKCCCSCC